MARTTLVCIFYIGRCFSSLFLRNYMYLSLGYLVCIVFLKIIENSILAPSAGHTLSATFKIGKTQEKGHIFKFVINI